MTSTLVIVGAALVVVAMVDAIVTTLSAGSGGGPLTTRLSKAAWRGMRAVAPGGASRVLTYSGAIVLLVTVLTWVLLLWTGWTLIFASSDGAVLDGTTGQPAPLTARIYYVGFVVFTLGIGDVVPGAGPWQVATAVASFLGLFLVTLAITYLMSVVSAAVNRRALARDIHLSGRTGVDIVRLHWNAGDGGGQFASLAQSLSTQILKTAQQHLAYPVLHHFHARERDSSAPRAMAALDDALLLMSAALPEHARPGSDTLVRLRRTVEHYAEIIETDVLGHADPPLPDLAALRSAGIPVVDEQCFLDAAAEHRDRRRRLDALVRADAWTWPEHPVSPTGE